MSWPVFVAVCAFAAVPILRLAVALEKRWPPKVAQP